MKKLFSSSSRSSSTLKNASASVKAAVKSGKATASGPEHYIHDAATELDLLRSPDPRVNAKAVEDLARTMRELKEILYGDTERFPNPELGIQVTAEIFKGVFLSRLIEAVPLMDFDTRRDASQIVANLQRQKVNNRMVASDYLASHTELLNLMIRGYENTDNALFYGSMLRDCIRHQSVAKYILDCPLFPKFFEYMDLPSFEVASDVAATFKELMTRHKSTVAEFLQRRYDFFFTEYNKLLESPNYITRRMAIKMLNEILLDRSNAATLKRYVSNKDNMRIIMMLLKEPNRSIEMEAIHLFVSFVTNESRPADITLILLSNKEKLIRFLTNFQLEKEDPRFDQDKAQVLEIISNLHEP